MSQSGLSLCNKETQSSPSQLLLLLHLLLQEPGYFIRCLFAAWIEFARGLTDPQTVSLSWAQIPLQRSDVSGLARLATVSTVPSSFPASSSP